MNKSFLGSSKPFFNYSFCGDVLGSYLHADTSIFRHIPHGQLQQVTV